MIVAAWLALAAASAQAPAPEGGSALSHPAAVERARWYDCLESYAQVAMASTATNATIAVESQAACAAERRAFQTALWRSGRVEGDGGVLIARLEAEDRIANAHVIAFIERLR